MPKGKKGAGDPADGPDVDAGAKAIAEVMSLRTQLGMRQTALTDAETAKRQAEESSPSYAPTSTRSRRPRMKFRRT